MKENMTINKDLKSKINKDLIKRLKPTRKVKEASMAFITAFQGPGISIRN